MEIKDKVALITGAGSGIGQAVARDLAKRGAKAIALVDVNESVKELAAELSSGNGTGPKAEAFIGSVSDQDFCRSVYDQVTERYGLVTICVPAAGITRDGLATKLDKTTGKISVYPVETFRQVLEINLVAPVYWALEMVARIAQDRYDRGLKRWDPDERIQGTVIFIGSVSSQGTDTPMVRKLGEEYIEKYVLPYTQLRRLIRTEEIADAICFMIANSAVSGELWADAGWHPSP